MVWPKSLTSSRSWTRFAKLGGDPAIHLGTLQFILLLPPLILLCLVGCIVARVSTFACDILFTVWKVLFCLNSGECNAGSWGSMIAGVRDLRFGFSSSSMDPHCHSLFLISRPK